MERKNIQSEFLTRLQRERTQGTVVVTNGFQLKGQIVDFDQFTLLVESGGARQMVYKSAVSTIREEG